MPQERHDRQRLVQVKRNQPGNVLYLGQAAEEKGVFPIPPASKQPISNKTSPAIARVNILSEEEPCSPADKKKAFVSPRMAKIGGSCIEIEVKGAAFLFYGSVEPDLYEKTLHMIGGQL